MLALSGLAGFGIVSFRLERHRYVLRALALGSRSIDSYELEDFVSEPGRLTRRWLLPQVPGGAGLGAWGRPREIDLATATSVALLGAIVAAAASLVLYIAVRALFLQVMELAPPEV